MVIVGEPAVGGIVNFFVKLIVGCCLTGRALAFGARDCEFESHHPNSYYKIKISIMRPEFSTFLEFLAIVSLIFFLNLFLTITNVVLSAFTLLLISVVISFLLFLLDIDFFGFVILTVQAGAIIILFLFVILTISAPNANTKTIKIRSGITTLLVFFFFFLLLILINNFLKNYELFQFISDFDQIYSLSLFCGTNLQNIAYNLSTTYTSIIF